MLWDPIAENLVRSSKQIPCFGQKGRKAADASKLQLSCGEALGWVPRVSAPCLPRAAPWVGEARWGSWLDAPLVTAKALGLEALLGAAGFQNPFLSLY